MSADNHNHDGHGAHGDEALPHSTLGGYVKGFLLATILTIIPFWMVMGKVFANSQAAGIVLLGLAALQVVVHMVYFLHMNTKSEGGWSMLAMLFTVMLLFIMMAGSIWVMYHLNHNMMPGMMPPSP